MTKIGQSSYCRVGLGELVKSVSHEVGHCIGFKRHATDGGLMDWDGGVVGSGHLTSSVRKLIKLLYSLPPGTNIEPYL